MKFKTKYRVDALMLHLERRLYREMSRNRWRQDTKAMRGVLAHVVDVTLRHTVTRYRWTGRYYPKAVFRRVKTKELPRHIVYRWRNAVLRSMNHNGEHNEVCRAPSLVGAVAWAIRNGGPSLYQTRKELIEKLAFELDGE